MSNARSIFERYSTSLAAIEQSIVHPAREENLYLDFKKAADGKGPATKPDRKNLSKALSGFANSEGGVIVWGVQC